MTDNFYNNVPLFQFLKDQGTYVIETKINSTGFPQGLKKQGSLGKESSEGGGKVFQNWRCIVSPVDGP